MGYQILTDGLTLITEKFCSQKLKGLSNLRLVPLVLQKVPDPFAMIMNLSKRVRLTSMGI